MRPPAQNAELALLLEVAGTPKPGNVDRRRDLGLRFEHFLAGAVGAQDGLEMAADGASVGAAFERAVGEWPPREATTRSSARCCYSSRSFEPRVTSSHSRSSNPSSRDDRRRRGGVLSGVRARRRLRLGPASGDGALDVRRGSDAVPVLEERGLTLFDVLDRSVPGDDVAREWSHGFERSFLAAQRLADASGTPSERTASVFLSCSPTGPIPWSSNATARSPHARSPTARPNFTSATPSRRIPTLSRPLPTNSSVEASTRDDGRRYRRRTVHRPGARMPGDMTDPTDDPAGTVGDDERVADWPVALSGVTESVVTTLGPNGRWNAAALGLFAGDPVTARTWGNTRTKRNFHRRGEGYVQFVDDPVVFTDAALSLRGRRADPWGGKRLGQGDSRVDRDRNRRQDRVGTVDARARRLDGPQNRGPDDRPRVRRRRRGDGRRLATRRRRLRRVDPPRPARPLRLGRRPRRRSARTRGPRTRPRTLELVTVAWPSRPRSAKTSSVSRWVGNSSRARLESRPSLYQKAGPGPATWYSTSDARRPCSSERCRSCSSDWASASSSGSSRFSTSGPSSGSAFDSSSPGRSPVNRRSRAVALRGRVRRRVAAVQPVRAVSGQSRTHRGHRSRRRDGRGAAQSAAVREGPSRRTLRRSERPLCHRSGD